MIITITSYLFSCQPEFSNPIHVFQFYKASMAGTLFSRMPDSCNVRQPYRLMDCIPLITFYTQIEEPFSKKERSKNEELFPFQRSYRFKQSESAAQGFSDFGSHSHAVRFNKSTSTIFTPPTGLFAFILT